MIKILSKYLKKKKLQLNTGKSRIMCFKKEGNRKKNGSGKERG